MREPDFSRRKLLQAGGAILALQASGPWVSRLKAKPFGASPVCLATAKTSYPPLLERFIAMLDPVSDNFPSEVYAAELDRVLAAWTSSLCEKLGNEEVIREHLSESISGFHLDGVETTPLRTTGSLLIERRTFQDSEIKGKENLLKQWAAYLSPLAELQTAELEIYGLHVTGESPPTVETELRCDLVGKRKDGSREQRVGSWTIRWVRDQPSDGWTVHRWIMRPEVVSRLTGPGFTDITARSVATSSDASSDTIGAGMRQLLPGVDHWRTVLDGASGIDVYGNHGIAVGDIDGSGFDSFYVCQPSGLPNRLYRNRRDGTFEDVTEVSGTGILDGTAAALFADFRNLGKQDLLVMRSTGPLLFVNQGDGRFEPRPDAFHFARPPQGTFTSVAAADYNRDGFLDVYFCVYSYYQGLNQYQFPTPYYDAQNGPPNFLFRNRGDGTFEDVTVAAGINQNNNRFSFAAAWCDYEGKGWPSLYVANDFGRKNLYRNSGNGTFTDVAHQLGVEDYGPGMSVCWLDCDNDGRQDVYVANMWLAEGKRITASDQFLPSAPSEVRALYQKHNAGNSLYRNNGCKDFKDESVEAGTAVGRWSWSCASWDFDHDGYPDLYVANGFVSGPNRLDLQSFFWRQVAQRSLSFEGGSGDYEMAWNAVNELLRSDYSWSGYERNVFFANNGDGTFSDVSGVLGLDLRDDSRAFALSDFDHDGRLEFVLKNRSGPQVRIMRNDLEHLGNSLSIQLVGSISNRDAIGAVVTIDSGSSPQTKFVQAGSGFASQHTKELFFGVGGVTDPVAVSVQWPAGGVEHYSSVPVNHRIRFTESGKEFQADPYRPSGTPGAKAEPLPSPPIPLNVNTWLIQPLFGPDIKLRGRNGDVQLLSAFKGRPALLNFFRLDCADSRKQVDHVGKQTTALSAAGLSMIAVAVGTVSADLPFPFFRADDRAVGAWSILWRYIFDRRRDMPIPVSFLLDKDGAILRIYQGTADPMEIVNDSKSAPATPDEQFRRAMPFPGPYYGNAMAHNYFTDGIAFVEYGYEDEAKEAFERVVHADPNHAGAWFNLGTIFLNKRQFPDARRCLLESVRLNPQDADAWNNLGMVAGEEQNFEQALAYFEKASRANPNHLLAVQNLIKILQYQGRATDAQQILEELIGRAPRNADLHLALGMAFVGQKQMDRAREELETAVKLNPNHPDALNDLGALLLRTGHTNEALARFEQCRQLAPDLDRPYLNIAIAYKGMGQIAKAREVLSEFLSRHPENAEVRSSLEKLGSN